MLKGFGAQKQTKKIGKHGLAKEKQNPNFG
jgi:hypothetical protein